MFLVTGATGRTGSEVVRALLAGGHAVRAFVRDPAKARDLLGDAVELALGDFADPASVRAAFEGVECVFLSCADDPRRVDWEARAIDVAVSTGVGRIVKLSSIVAEPGAPVAFWDWHGQVERHLAQSGLPAVILRSSAFMSNVVAAAEQVAHQDRLYAPAGEARIAMIDPRDVGACAAAVMTTAGHDGGTYVLTGPEAITYAQVATGLSAATDRMVEFVDVPDDGGRQGMIQAGTPDVVAEQIVEIYAMLRRGANSTVTATVESLTGRPPRSFASFARDHAHLFSPAAAGTGR
jgi:uncharacterized protein YbjT (DUF2867 family)